MQQKVNSSELMGFEENGIGHCIRMSREARGYSQLDICDGICSIATLSLIEDGKEKADYWTLEALLDRMRVNKTEYDFFLDDDTFAIQTQGSYQTEHQEKRMRGGRKKSGSISGKIWGGKPPSAVLISPGGLLGAYKTGIR